MELYVVFFILLALLAIVLARWLQRRQAERLKDGGSVPTGDDNENKKPIDDPRSIAEAAHFQKIYFGVYILVVAADWLQGPYIYSLYRYGHGLSEATTAAMFTTGFVAAGASASFAGALADKYGRRNACLAYCGIYSVSCLSVLAYGNLPVLFFGRALGGLSSTLLYSVFEAWMVSEHNARNLGNALPLSQMFSWSVTLSGVVAIASGVVGEAVVSATGSKTSPFMLAVGCLVLAAYSIDKFWNENYGQVTTPIQNEEEASIPHFAQLDPNLDKQRILTLTLITSIFEGSMYLFVFLWNGSLNAAREAAITTSPSLSKTLPLGLIFSSFMCAMMIGSMVISVMALYNQDQNPASHLVDTLAIAASALLIPVIARSETSVFWSFALFEACVGMYYPTIGKIKSKLVPDSSRAKVYAWMRLPLNVFVVVALGLTKEGMFCRAHFVPGEGELTKLSTQATNIDARSSRSVVAYCLQLRS
jgi:MFS family permease